MYSELRALETLGTCRRGYFVDGLGAAQFALPGAVDRLRAMRDQDGNPLQVVELPMPGVIEYDGQRLPASYANFYIANGIVLVPVFNDPNDRFALDILADLFPDRDVIGIYSGDLIWGFGAMHCMTQQQPSR